MEVPCSQNEKTKEVHELALLSAVFGILSIVGTYGLSMMPDAALFVLSFPVLSLVTGYLALRSMSKAKGQYRGIGHVKFGLGSGLVIGGMYLLIFVTTILRTE